jgi:hypothetical protein
MFRFAGRVNSESRGTKKILVRTLKQQGDGALVPRSNASNEAIVSATNAFDVELLPRLNPVHLA